jgi:hypothetical protein
MSLSFQNDVSEGMSVTCDAKLVGCSDADTKIPFDRPSDFHTYSHPPTFEGMVPALVVRVRERKQDESGLSSPCDQIFLSRRYHTINFSELVPETEPSYLSSS